MGEVKKFDVAALRKKALESDDIVYDSIYVDSWGGEYPVKTLAGLDFKTVMKAKDDPIRMAILAVVFGCVTPDGERVFNDTHEAVAIMEKKGVKAITEVSAKILEISGLGEKAVDNAKN
jgi:hypothetical protein